MTQIFHDKLKVEDSMNGFPKGVLYNKEKTPTGKTVFKKIGENKITLGLSQEIAKYLINEDEDVTKIRQLDDESDLNLMDVTSVQDENKRIFGFGLSIDGGSENNIRPVRKYSKGYNLNEGLIPFRVIPADSHDVELMHNNGYLVRDFQPELFSDDGNDNDYMRYFIKRFDDINIMNIQENGNELPDEPSENLSLDINVYSIIDLELSIDKDDLAEYFSLAEGDINNRRYNAITLFMGKECNKTDGDDTVSSFTEILATNRMNIRQRNIGEEGIQNMVYRIYV